MIPHIRCTGVLMLQLEAMLVLSPRITQRKGPNSEVTECHSVREVTL